jgi:hypothetical protein
MRQKVKEVAQQIGKGSVFNEPSRAKLVETRKTVVAGWLAAGSGSNSSESCIDPPLVRSIRRDFFAL